MNIEFAGDVLAMRNDGVRGDTQHIGYLFVAQSAYDLHEHVSLAVGQFFGLGEDGFPAFASRLVAIVHRRTEDVVLDGAMVRKILLGVPEVAHHADERVGYGGRVTGYGRRIVLDDEVLDLRQLGGDALVVMLVLLEKSCVLVLYVRADLLDELVIAAEDESGDLGGGVGRDDGFDQCAAQARQAEIEEIGVGVVQVALQGRDVDVGRQCPLVEDLVIDDRQECGRVYAMQGAYLLDRLFAYTHLQPETADDLNCILFMRHQIAYFVTRLVHA